MRKIWSASTLEVDAKDRTVQKVTYGSLTRTHSSQGLRGVGKLPSRTSSFNDLPLVAVAGLETRVSISGTSTASDLDLARFFSGDSALEAVVVEGGWTRPLVLSTAAALLSALQFGYNNGNMNTQADVMRDALGIPARLDASCPPAQDYSASSMIWGFCVSSFCLSALVGSVIAGPLADRCAPAA